MSSTYDLGFCKKCKFESAIKKTTKLCDNCENRIKKEREERERRMEEKQKQNMEGKDLTSSGSYDDDDY